MLGLTQKTARTRSFHRRIALIEVCTGKRTGGGGGQLSSEFAPLIREIVQNQGAQLVEQLELQVLAFVCLLIENKLVPRSPVSVSRTGNKKYKNFPAEFFVWRGLCGGGGEAINTATYRLMRVIGVGAVEKEIWPPAPPGVPGGRGSIKPNANVGIPHAIFPPAHNFRSL